MLIFTDISFNSASLEGVPTAMKIKRNLFIGSETKHAISYEHGRITLDFESLDNTQSPYLGGRTTGKFGQIEFIRANGFDLQCNIVFCPMNMYDGGEAEFEKRLEIVENLEVNGFEVLAQRDDVVYQSSVLIAPEEVGEEGWFFSFSEASIASNLTNGQKISAKKILEDITLADSFELTINRFVTGGSGYRFFSVKIEELDKWRNAFSNAFGKELLESIAAARGLILEE